MGACQAKMAAMKDKAVLPNVKLPGLSKEDSARLENRTKELCVTFTKQYLKAYKTNLIAKIRAEVNATEGGEKLQLVVVEPPKPATVRIAAKLEQARDLEKPKFENVHAEINGDWELTFASKEGSKAELVMNLFGYKVHEHDFKTDEKKYGVTLKHNNDDKPQVLLVFKNEEEYTQWKSILEKSIKKSKNPIATEPWLVETFRQAYRNTRWICWLWGTWDLDGDAGEMLGGLFYQIMESEIINDILRPITNDTAKKGVRAAVRKIINAAVGAAWTAIQEAIVPARQIVEKAAQQYLGEIFKAEKDLKGQIVDKCIDTINPGLEKLKPVFTAVFDKVVAPIREGSLEMFVVFNESIESVVKEISSNASTTEGPLDSIVDRAIRNAIWHVDWRWWGRQRRVTNKLYELYEAHRSDWDIYRSTYQLIDEYCDLSVIALKYLQVELTAKLEVANRADIRTIVIETSESIVHKLAHDIMFINEAVILRLLCQKGSDFSGEHIMSALNKILEPMTEMVPEVARDIIDPQRTGEEVVDDLIEEISKKIVKTGFTEIHASVEKQANVAKNNIVNITA